jgi:hypothetical protein
MAASVRFVLNPRGIREMLNEDFVRSDLTKRGERVLSQAQAGEPDYSYHIEQAKTDRAVVRVGSDDPEAIYAELNSGNLVRALDAGGGSS